MDVRLLCPFWSVSHWWLTAIAVLITIIFIIITLLFVRLLSLRRKDTVGRTDAKLRFYAPRDGAARGFAVSALATLGDTTIATSRAAFPGQKGSDAVTPELLGIKSLPLSSKGTQCAAAGKRQTDSKRNQAGFKLPLLAPQKVNLRRLWYSPPTPHLIGSELKLHIQKALLSLLVTDFSLSCLKSLLKT